MELQGHKNPMLSTIVFEMYFQWHFLHQLIRF